MEKTEKKVEFNSTLTEHPAAEELRLSEKRFRSVFEAAPLGIAIADPGGYILEANDVFFRLLDAMFLHRSYRSCKQFQVALCRCAGPHGNAQHTVGCQQRQI